MKFIEFTQEPERLRKICDTFNYISSVRSIAKQQGEANPELQPFVDQMDTARARSQDGGAKYPRNLSRHAHGDSTCSHRRSQRRRRVEGSRRENQGHPRQKVRSPGRKRKSRERPRVEYNARKSAAAWSQGGK